MNFYVNDSIGQQGGKFYRYRGRFSRSLKTMLAILGTKDRTTHYVYFIFLDFAIL